MRLYRYKTNINHIGRFVNKIFISVVKLLEFASPLPQQGNYRMPFRDDRLIQLRKSQGYNQTELAELVGTTQNQVSRYERGVHVPPSETLEAIAKALNTSADYLLGLSNVPYPGAEPQPDLTPLEAEALAILQQYSEVDQARLVEILRQISDIKG